MNKLIDWIMSLSKGAQIALAVILVIILGGGGYYVLYGSEKEEEESQGDYNVSKDFPDGETYDMETDKLKELKRASMQNVNDYWASLESDDSSGGLLGSGVQNDDSDAKYMHKGVYLDPEIYTATEIERIQLGIETKESIDARKAAKAERDRPASVKKELTQEQQDSIYFARMERAYGMAMKYTDAGGQMAQEVEEPEPVEEVIETEEEKNIEIPIKSLPSVAVSEDDIFSSLGSGWDTPLEGSSTAQALNSPSPARATFLRTETLVNGQRVTMRLMEDLALSDGTVIPANTHIKGTCKMSSRLNIEVSAISYGGRIYYVNLNIYDNDGTEGIYCPVISESKGVKAGKDIASTALSGVASTAATLFTRSATLGRVVRQGIGEISGSIDGHGNITVKVASGYEFYVFEEIKNR